MMKNLVKGRRTELKEVRIQTKAMGIIRTRIITSKRMEKEPQTWWPIQIQVIRISARIPVSVEISKTFAQVVLRKPSKL